MQHLHLGDNCYNFMHLSQIINEFDVKNLLVLKLFNYLCKRIITT